MKEMNLFKSVEVLKNFDEFESYCLHNNICKGLLRHIDNRNIDEAIAFGEVIELLGKTKVLTSDITDELETKYFDACLGIAEKMIKTSIEIKDWTWVDINKSWTYDNIKIKLNTSNWLSIPELCDLVLPCSYIKVWSTKTTIKIGKLTDAEHIFSLVKPYL